MTAPEISWAEARERIADEESAGVGATAVHTTTLERLDGRATLVFGGQPVRLVGVVDLTFDTNRETRQIAVDLRVFRPNPFRGPAERIRVAGDPPEGT